MFSSHEIAGLLYNRPLCIHPDKLPMICAAVAGTTGVAIDEQWRKDADGKINRLPAKVQTAMRGPVKNQRPPSPYSKVGGIGLIQVHGSLVNRGGWIGAYSGVSSYEGLAYQLRHALVDPETTAVLLDINSPGGQAAGAFETAALVRDLAAHKRVVAVVDDLCASAAFAIASGATEIVITPSGIAGSVGVVLMHLDQSARLEKAGVKPSLIHAGAKKIDANSFQPLPANVREDLQSEVDKVYEMFVACVAAGRAMLTPDAIRKTEAACFIGADAVAAGLVDRIGSLDAVLGELAASNPPKEIVIDPPVAPSPAMFTQADLDRARAEGRAQGMDEAVTDGGIAAAHARITAILDLPEARGREKSAQHLAMAGQLPIATAKAMLAATPTDADALRSNNLGLYLVEDQERTPR